MKKTLSRTYWDIYSIFYDKLYKFPPYNQMVTEVYNFLDVNEKGSYLDVGCGTGVLTNKIAEKCLKVYGIDYSSFMLKMAIRKNKSDRALFLKGDVTKHLPFKKEFFDGISCIHVINYIKNPYLVISELSRVLKKGGKLALVYIEKLNFVSNIPFYKEFLVNEKIEGIETLLPFLVIGIMNIPIKIGHGTNFYSKEEMRKMLREHELTPIIEKKVYAGQSIFVGCKKV